MKGLNGSQANILFGVTLCSVRFYHFVLFSPGAVCVCAFV